MYSINNQSVLLFIIIVFFQITTKAQNIDEARQAFRDYKVDSASMLFTRVLDYEKASNKDRARAARMLSLFHGDFNQILKMLRNILKWH